MSTGVVTLSHFYRISSKFHVWIASIKLLFKLEYKLSPTNDNQDGQQNGRRLSVCICGQSTLIIYYLIASKFHLWITFIKLYFMSEYWFRQMNDYQDFRQNGYPLFAAGHKAGPFVRVWLF